MSCPVTFLLVRRLLDLLRLGPAPDEKDVEIACSATNWRCYAAKWHGLGTPRPIALCWPRWPGCSAVSAGRPSSSRRRHCCAGTGSSSLGRGPTLAAAASHQMPSTTTSSTWSCEWPGRTPAGATSASWRLPEARGGRYGDERAQRATPSPHPAGAANIGAFVVAVPASPSRGHARM